MVITNVHSHIMVITNVHSLRKLRLGCGCPLVPSFASGCESGKGLKVAEPRNRTAGIAALQ
jgi:hypothetical protein